VDAQVPLLMALDDPGAAPGVAGGKGASLARLARARFRVPPGFHVTTSAYLDFIGRGGLREPVLASLKPVLAWCWINTAVGLDQLRRRVDTRNKSSHLLIE
jgi:hypothetical protein